MVQVADAAAAGDGFVEHGAAVHLFHVLAEVADGELLGDGDFAFVGRFLADDHAEEGGLAGAVGADQADLFARVELERGVDEDELFAVLLVDVGEGNHENWEKRIEFGPKFQGASQDRYLPPCYDGGSATQRARGGRNQIIARLVMTCGLEKYFIPALTNCRRPCHRRIEGH